MTGGRRASSRLDRFLCTREWLEEFPELSLSLGSRVVLDHFPLILESSPVSWVPTPFRFENMWLLHNDFKKNIREWWVEGEEQGWAGFRFIRKLTFAKEKLKVWNKETFGDVRIRKKGCWVR